ncbi:MAG: type II toxin-antitoxin system antitoxin SocA domain-containing protein [Bacillota bacterium]
MSKVNVFDVAVYILNELGSVSGMKLQKLVYYCQAWSLVWEDRPLFSEEIQAWVNGPVVPTLYENHRGDFLIDQNKFKKLLSGQKFSKAQIETMDIVIKHYGKRNAQWLSDLTHSEQPWIDARKGLSEKERGASAISQEQMSEFYSSL